VMRATTLFGVLLAGSLYAGGLDGQVARQPGPQVAEFGAAAPWASGVDAARPNWKHRLFTGLGGAAVGFGLGFFASQMNQSDWAETPGQSQVSRGLWAAVGGGVGFAVGFSFPIRGRSQRPDNIMTVSSANRSVIGPAEFLDLSVDNAYDIVRRLRPEWLNSRPPDVFGQSGPQTVPVYLDDFRYGEIESLRGIHVQTISSIRFVSPSVATARWGTGHIAGVIQVITSG
jgi:hypothetical protein